MCAANVITTEIIYYRLQAATAGYAYKNSMDHIHAVFMQIHI